MKQRSAFYTTLIPRGSSLAKAGQLIICSWGLAMAAAPASVDFCAPSQIKFREIQKCVNVK